MVRARVTKKEGHNYTSTAPDGTSTYSVTAVVYSCIKFSTKFSNIILEYGRTRVATSTSEMVPVLNLVLNLVPLTVLRSRAQGSVTLPKRYQHLYFMYSTYLICYFHKYTYVLNKESISRITK
jgi:hypothetical protein